MSLNLNSDELFVCFCQVSVENLPYLPDCPVASMVAVPYVGNVECVCSDVKCQTQIRIKPIAGT